MAEKSVQIWLENVSCMECDHVAGWFIQSSAFYVNDFGQMV